MKQVSELYGLHAGSDIYVIGTGTSLRVFPKSFFEGKITIGLNMAWKSVPVRYAITIHPDLNIPEYIGELPQPDIKWIVPFEKSRALLSSEDFEDADSRCYSFEYTGQPNRQPLNQPSDSGRMLEWVRRPTNNSLYVWSSIAQTGANLAANMGARNVIMVGCDHSSLNGNNHAHLQHTRWKGVRPEDRYDQYYEGMAEVRSALRERGVNVLSAQPFLGIGREKEDFFRLCKENGYPLLIEGRDISSQINMQARLKYYLHLIKSKVKK